MRCHWAILLLGASAEQQEAACEKGDTVIAPMPSSGCEVKSGCDGRNGEAVVLVAGKNGRITVSFDHGIQETVVPLEAAWDKQGNRCDNSPDDRPTTQDLIKPRKAPRKGLRIKDFLPWLLGGVGVVLLCVVACFCCSCGSEDENEPATPDSEAPPVSKLRRQMTQPKRNAQALTRKVTRTMGKGAGLVRKVTQKLGGGGKRYSTPKTQTVHDVERGETKRHGGGHGGDHGGAPNLPHAVHHHAGHGHSGAARLG